MVSYRIATRADLPGLWEVRYSVVENTLKPGKISDDELRCALEDVGRGWVAERHGRILGFAIGLTPGHVWALFVRPEAEGQGIGSELHALLLLWYATLPVQRLWLTTGLGTRALQFYLARGWRLADLLGDGEVMLERANLHQTNQANG
jgi:GNAT superfamily N-acetyltransferase